MLRHALVYLLLVGGPTLGLLGILRVGATLEAPARVHGGWTVEAPPCVEGAHFGIEQSGRHLVVRTPEAVTARVEQGDRLHAAWTPTTGPCAGRVLRVVLTPDEGRQRLSGTLETDCACSSAGLTARRSDP